MRKKDSVGHISPSSRIVKKIETKFFGPLRRNFITTEAIIVNHSDSNLWTRQLQIVHNIVRNRHVYLADSTKKCDRV